MSSTAETETETGASGEVPPICAAGEIVAGRYRILRFIARGGAGEVYEAEDRELGSRVALKAIRRDHAPPAAIERFKREINLARQVTHPNVCRIYEFGSETRGDAQILFLTMEFLEGETLLQRIHRSGPMKPAEAMPMVRQMAAGLQAAEKADVVHRDFKSGNVLLVPAAEKEGGLRAVITDFGLAKTVSGDEDAGPQVTAHNLIVGTPAYMAPEQVESGPISPATDLYAFGVVLYEMLTGHYPFEAETSLGTAVLRLREEPISPRLYAPDLEPRWERAILRCLERDPADRFASVGELMAAIAGGRRKTDRPDAGRRDAGPRVARWPAALRLARPAALAAGLALIAAAVWVLRSGMIGPESADEASGSAAASQSDARTADARTADARTAGARTADARTADARTAAPRRALALLGFKNLSGRADSAWLSTALTEMLATEAAAGERIRVVRGDKVARAKIQLGLGETDGLDSDGLARVGELLGTDLVVEGSYLLAGAEGEREIRLDLKVREVGSGEILARLSERGTETGVLDLVESVGSDLRGALGVGAISPAEAQAVRASLPAGPEAARLYAEGLERLRLNDAQAALERLQDAVESDPENPLIHSALALAWDTLGHGPRAREAARRAFELAGDLGREDRLRVEAHYHDVAGAVDRQHRRQAVEIWGILWGFFPDNVEYGLRLAEAQAAVGQPDAALETVAELRRLPAGAEIAGARIAGTRIAGTRIAGARIDLAEALAAQALSDYARQQASAARAASPAEALGAGLLVARARELEAGAWRDLGQHEKARAAYGEAREIYARANDRGAVARVLIDLAIVDRRQGRFDAARALLDEALAVAREIGDQGSIRLALGMHAIILRQQGKLSEAKAMHELELEANRESGYRRSIAFTLTSLGVVERDMGDLDGARARFEEALELGRAVGDQHVVAMNLNLTGEVLLRRGRPAAAMERFEEALAIDREIKNPRGQAFCLSSLGDVDLAAGDLAAAREKYEQALEIFRSLGERTNVAASLAALARLELEAGRPERAASRAREAAAELGAEATPDDEALALALRAAARLEQGRSAEARAAIERAAELLEGSENRGHRLELAIRAAEVEAAAGEVAAARAGLEEALAEAEALGFVDLRLEAGLVLGRIELRAGESAGTARLAAVAREASERGFELLAGKAEAALR